MIREEFVKLLTHAGKLSPDKIQKLFIQIDHTHKGHITFGKFLIVKGEFLFFV